MYTYMSTIFKNKPYIQFRDIDIYYVYNRESCLTIQKMEIRKKIKTKRTNWKGAIN